MEDDLVVNLPPVRQPPARRITSNSLNNNNNNVSGAGREEDDDKDIPVLAMRQDAARDLGIDVSKIHAFRPMQGKHLWTDVEGDSERYKAFKTQGFSIWRIDKDVSKSLENDIKRLKAILGQTKMHGKRGGCKVPEKRFLRVGIVYPNDQHLVMNIYDIIGLYMGYRLNTPQPRIFAQGCTNQACVNLDHWARTEEATDQASSTQDGPVRKKRRGRPRVPKKKKQKVVVSSDEEPLQRKRRGRPKKRKAASSDEEPGSQDQVPSNHEASGESDHEALDNDQSSDRETPDVQSSDHETPDDQSSDHETPDDQSSNHETPDAQSSDRETPDDQSSNRETPDAQSSDRETPDQSSGRETPDAQASDHEAPDEQPRDDEVYTAEETDFFNWLFNSERGQAHRRALARHRQNNQDWHKQDQDAQDDQDDQDDRDQDAQDDQDDQSNQDEQDQDAQDDQSDHDEQDD